MIDSTTTSIIVGIVLATAFLQPSITRIAKRMLEGERKIEAHLGDVIPRRKPE